MFALLSKGRGGKKDWEEPSWNYIPELPALSHLIRERFEGLPMCTSQQASERSLVQVRADCKSVAVKSDVLREPAATNLTELLNPLH